MSSPGSPRELDAPGVVRGGQCAEDGLPAPEVYERRVHAPVGVLLRRKGDLKKKEKEEVVVVVGRWEGQKWTRQAGNIDQELTER